MEDTLLINLLDIAKKTQEIIAKIATGQGDDYANGYLLD